MIKGRKNRSPSFKNVLMEKKKRMKLLEKKELQMKPTTTLKANCSGTDLNKRIQNPLKLIKLGFYTLELRVNKP
jgi:hypothetical protein